MALALTKTAASVFAPTTAGAEPRGADMAEAGAWGSEVEDAIEALDDSAVLVEGAGIVITTNADGSRTIGLDIAGEAADAAVAGTELAVVSDAGTTKTVTLQQIANLAVPPSVALGSGYVSAEQTITNGGLLTLAHGLGAQPIVLQLFLIAKSAVLGFSVGDVIPISTAQGLDSMASRGVYTVVNATNVLVRFGTNGTVLTNQSLGSSAVVITNSDFRLIVRAFVA